MASIQQLQAQKQAPVVSYRYALRVTPDQVQRMNREQLQALCLEQMFLLWLIISIIRNPLAAIASRIIAIDLLISFVEKNIRGTLKDITERSRVYISGDGGTAKRLGIHANTVSKCFKSLEQYKFIQRDYIYDEEKQREYLDVTITPITLNQPAKLQDKSARTIKEAGKKQTVPNGTVSPDTGLSCPACGGNDVIVVCRSCGTSGIAEEFGADPDSPPPSPIIVEALENSLLNKNYVVDTNNAPQLPIVQETLPESEIAAIAQDIISDLSAASGQLQETNDLLSPVVLLSTWLERRRGHGKLIYATGSAETSKKYLAKPQDYMPDIQAYLRGNKDHVYGSYLLRGDATTSVLAFDIDDETLDQVYMTYLQTLSAAGASPVYWMRQNNRAHLELYFSSPVDPEAAYAWCVSVCTELAAIEEVYPVRQKRNSPISWPLYQRKDRTVYPCQAKVLYAGASQVAIVSGSDLAGLAALAARAVTPADLIPPLVKAPKPVAVQKAGPVPQSAQPLTERDIARLVIAEFNRITPWDEIIALCGGANRDGKFAAVWRGERTPSVKVDPNEQYACDYGRSGGYPMKLDKYEIWCLVQGGREYKKADLAKRCKQYREQLGQASPAPAQDIPQRETEPVAPAPLTLAQVPPPDETRDEIVERLRGTRFVMCPLGRGKLWRAWPSQIGVVLDSDPERVKFFKTLDEMRQVRAVEESESLFLNF